MQPRTHVDIIRDLYTFLKDQEWEDSQRDEHSCSCHPEYKKACICCFAYENPEHSDANTHDAGCRLDALLKETEAFLAVEYEIENSKNSELKKLSGV